MACSRMPKCSVRPYSSPGKSLVACAAGTNDGSPFMVVLLLSARSAEPPHSSGSTGARASRILPEAARVATPLASAGKVGQRVGPAGRQRTGGHPVPQRLALRVGLRPGVEPGGPLGLLLRAALQHLTGVLEHLLVDLEGALRVEAEDLLGGLHLVRAERRAVDLAGVLLVRRGPADDRAQRDERRPAGLRLGGQQRLVQRLHVLVVVALVGVAAAPVDGLHVPAVRLVAGRDVLALGDAGVVLDRDLVVVVDHAEVAELLVTGERAGLVGDALLDVTVGGDAPDVVPERRVGAVRLGVEQAALAAGRHRHADRVAEALAERPGGGLHARGVAVLRVARGERAPLAQRLEVVQRQRVAGEEELDVERQAGVAGGEHEPVASGPVRVGGVVPHDPVEEQVRRRGEAHRRPRVAVAGFLHGVHGQHADRVDGPAVEVGPVESGKLGSVGSHDGCAPRQMGGTLTDDPIERC